MSKKKLKKYLVSFLSGVMLLSQGANIVNAQEILATSTTQISNEILHAENMKFDGTEAVASKNSEVLQSKISEIMALDKGTITVRYRLKNTGSVIESLFSLSVPTFEQAYASIYVKPKTGKIGVEFKNTPNNKTAEFSFSNNLDINNTDWHTVSCVFTGSKIIFYFDGEKLGEYNFTGMFSDLSWKENDLDLTVGGVHRKFVSGNTTQNFLWNFTGTIDTVDINKNVSTDNDIKRIHSVTTEAFNVDKSYIFKQNEDDIFYYRIPSLIKASGGNLVIAADARKKHYNDWGDIKTVVKTSNNSGESWSSSKTVVDTPTQPYYTSTTIGSRSDTTSSMSIDPALLATSNNEVYMLVDVMPESRGKWFDWGGNDKGYLSGAYNSQLGSGYINVDGTKCLRLFGEDDTEYFVKKENNQGVVYKIITKDEANNTVTKYEKTDYTVSYGTKENDYSDYGDLYNLTKGNFGEEAAYSGNIYLTNNSTDPKTQGGSATVQANTHKGELRVLITNYLWLFKSTDGGVTWSEPTDITPSVKEEWMRFIGAGAGIGSEIVKEDGSKRLIFPIYYTNKNGSGIGLQSSAIIYSDDNGVTWQRSESANDGRIVNGQAIQSQTASSTDYDISENQVIQLNSGTLLQFMRTTSADQKVRIAKSTDYGLTWEDEFTNSGLRDIGCQLSVITMEHNNKEYVVFSNPTGDGPSKSAARYRGILRIGEVQSDDSIKWLTSNVIETGRFAYSSVVDLGNGDIGVAYEDSGNISYLTYNIDELLEKNSQDANIVIEEVKRVDGINDLVAGDEILIQVKTNQDLIMTGTRELDIKIGETSKKAQYVSGTGTDTFIFKYIVEQSDSEDLKVIGLSSNAVAENQYFWKLASPVEEYNLGLVKEIKYDDLSHVFNGDFSKNSNWIGKTSNASANKLEGDNYYGIIEQGTSDDYLVQYIDVEAGKNYKLIANVKVESENSEVPGVFLVVKYAINRNFKQIEIKNTNGWKTFEIEFTPEEGTEKVLVGLIKYAEGNNRTACSSATVSIDDVKVYQEKISDTEVKWIDDFEGTSLDTNVWGYELGRIRGNEQQHYVDSKENVFVSDGKLTLKVTERPEEYHYTNPSGGTNARQIIYNSGSVRTAGQKEFLYGRIEMRAKLPKGKGAFPAFWTLGADFSLDGLIDSDQAYGWPTTGEIDIMEMIGAPTDERLASGEEAATKTGDQQSNKKVYGTPHFYWANTTDGDKDGSYGQNYNNATGGNATFRDDLADDYHIYGINWTETKIEWYVDNEIYNVIYFSDLTDAQMQAAKASLNRPQYIQLNLATGGNWAGDAGQYLADDNTQFVIDWVKWSQNSEQEAAATEYYSDMPTLTSKLNSNDKNITIVKGQDIQSKDLLSYVELNAENASTEYEVRYSIDNEFMFVNNGIGPNKTGQTKVQLVYSNTSENGLVDSIQDLEAGVYNIHYTAVPKGTTKTISGKVTATSKLVRKTLKLVVLPNTLSGVEGEKLSSVTLPEGWSWENGETVLNKNVSKYNAVFTNTSNETDTRENVFTLPINMESTN